jgi:hypothetical protein
LNDAIVPVPSQSPQPFQSSLYVRLGLDGMSFGLSPDLQYSFQSVVLFNPSVRTYSLASVKDRNGTSDYTDLQYSLLKSSV